MVPRREGGGSSFTNISEICSHLWNISHSSPLSARETVSLEVEAASSALVPLLFTFHLEGMSQSIIPNQQ